MPARRVRHSARSARIAANEPLTPIASIVNMKQNPTWSREVQLSRRSMSATLSSAGNLKSVTHVLGHFCYLSLRLLTR